jgi:hypothetical protein
MTLPLALAFAEAGFAVVPVNVFRRGERWRKVPYVSWRGEKSQATTDPAKIKDMWDKHPSAMPGVVLRDHVIIDADRRPGKPDGVELLRALGPFPAHPINPSKSGQHHWWRQPPEPIRYGRWAGGEVLGIGRMVIGYAVPLGSIPVLPEIFWPGGHGSVLTKRVPSNGVFVGKDQHRCDPVLVGNLTAALNQMDPCEWHGEHDLWFELLMGAKFVGISLEDFVAWSTSDPDYADDGEIIAKKWHSIEPEHGGAFWRELSARGIKVQHPNAGHPHTPLKRQITISWWGRLNSVLAKLQNKKDGDMLFWAGCRVAETIADTGKPKPSVAVDLLVAAVSPVIKRDEAVRVISNAFDTIEQQILEAS